MRAVAKGREGLAVEVDCGEHTPTPTALCPEVEPTRHLHQAI